MQKVTPHLTIFSFCEGNELNSSSPNYDFVIETALTNLDHCTLKLWTVHLKEKRKNNGERKNETKKQNKNEKKKIHLGTPLL